MKVDKMDHSSGHSSHESMINESFDPYVVENGRRYMVPYRIIKRAVFEGVDKRGLIDIPHAARLQYRLMLMDPVIKASVDFTKAKITVLYNPTGSDNNKEKISLEEIIAFLAKEGVATDPSYTTVEDYDYYKNFYSYAYNPSKIRERAPYGYRMEQWQKMKPEWERKMVEGNAVKKIKFKNFQESYLDSNPDAAAAVEPGRVTKKTKPTLKERIFGRGNSNGQGFWFHGI